MPGNDDAPSPRSAWERDLERINDEDAASAADLNARITELREEIIDLERGIAEGIAGATDRWADAQAVLEAHDYDGDDLRDTHNQVVRPHLAAAVAGHPAEDREPEDVLAEYADKPDGALAERVRELFRGEGRRLPSDK